MGFLAYAASYPKHVPINSLSVEYFVEVAFEAQERIFALDVLQRTFGCWKRLKANI